MPYLSQRYSGGNHCDRDPDPETGEARPPIRRSAELRLMCSPDSELHIVAMEPDQCTYLVELYVPQLCALPQMAVEPPPGGWRPLGSASIRGGINADGSELQGDDDEEGDPYELPEDESEEDDPYVDPSEL